MYKNKKIFILGMAKSGYEVAKLLASDNTVFITDMKNQDESQVKELKDLGVTFKILDNPEDYIDDSYDLMVKNPGIKYNHKCVVKAKELGIPVVNEIEVAYHYIDKSVKIIGVTGSNGKTTTTSIIYEIMKKSFGEKVILAGNIGTPLSHYVKNIKKNSYLVMEISDHQLCDMYDFKTNVSVITNIYECHTDFHDSHERYVNTKKKIFMNHNNDDVNIINYDNYEVMGITRDINGVNKYFSKNSEEDCYYKDGFIYYEGKRLIDVSKIILKGEHNYENIMCTILACKVYGVSDNDIISVVNTFGGVEHRLEYVGNINGREVYNDSKSTNVESTKIALNSFDKPTILLMGGTDRGHSFDELEEDLKYTKFVVTYGETKNRIKNFMDKISVKCIVVDTLIEAVKEAYTNSNTGDIILLSPACASLDQFPNFEERGKLFKEEILKYKNNNNNFFLEKNKNIYFMGIGGISMSGIADILKSWGYKVSGSDKVESKIVDKLRQNGIIVKIPQTGSNISDDIDFIVYTAAIKNDNPEMIMAKKKNIPMMERGAFLGEITKLFNDTIGVAGTHGKTSTTSMLSCIFLETNIDPTIQVGSILNNIGGNYRVGKSDTLIIEACEYSDSYLSFEQRSAIVLDIDNDHLDYFKNLDNIKKLKGILNQFDDSTNKERTNLTNKLHNINTLCDKEAYVTKLEKVLEEKEQALANTGLFKLKEKDELRKDINRLTKVLNIERENLSTLIKDNGISSREAIPVETKEIKKDILKSFTALEETQKDSDNLRKQFIEGQKILKDYEIRKAIDLYPELQGKEIEYKTALQVNKYHEHISKISDISSIIENDKAKMSDLTNDISSFDKRVETLVLAEQKLQEADELLVKIKAIQDNPYLHGKSLHDPTGKEEYEKLVASRKAITKELVEMNYGSRNGILADRELVDEQKPKHEQNMKQLEELKEKTKALTNIQRDIQRAEKQQEHTITR